MGLLWLRLLRVALPVIILHASFSASGSDWGLDANYVVQIIDTILVIALNYPKYLRKWSHIG